MHFCRDPGLLQRDVVNQRVVDTVHGIILGVQQKSRRRPARHRDIGIQLKLVRPNLEVSGVKGHGEIRAAAFFVRRIYSRIQTFVKVRADIGHQVPAC